MLVRPAACKHLPSQIKVLFFSDAHASISKKGRYTVVDSTLQASVDVQKLSGNDIFSALGSTPGGLSASEAEKRQVKEGKNLIETVKKKSPIIAFLSNFTHLMAILLWAAGFIAFFAGMPELGVAVWLVNVINGCFSFWQEHRASKATEALKKMLPSYVNVIRDGNEQKILAEDLVTGDVMLLAEGDKISADARVVRASDLQVDQSTLTGESNPVRKTADAVLDNTAPVGLWNLALAAGLVSAN